MRLETSISKECGKTRKRAVEHHFELVDTDSRHLALMPIWLKIRDKTGANQRIESMKKANRARKPSKAKAPTRKSKGRAILFWIC